jgi:transglutaminase-like putative cysteine protease
MKKIMQVLVSCFALAIVFDASPALAQRSGDDGGFFSRLFGSRGGSSEIRELAQYIVDGARDEEDKAYAIYSWVASEISYDSSARDSAESVLRTRSAKCGGYTNLMKALLDAVGLENRTKSARIYAPWFAAGLVGHAWNEVRVNGRWIHVDATWGRNFPGEYFDFGGHQEGSSPTPGRSRDSRSREYWD